MIPKRRDYTVADMIAEKHLFLGAMWACTKYPLGMAIYRSLRTDTENIKKARLKKNKDASFAMGY